MTEDLQTVLRHDDPEAALPHQIELPEGWGVKLPDPVQFQVTLPRWCPMDDDSLVALHWWASLSTHLHLLSLYVRDEQTVSYRVERALRHALQTVREVYGTSVMAALSAASVDARDRFRPTQGPEEHELGAWTMAVQCSFGLLCTRTIAKGEADPIAQEMAQIHEWVSTGLQERLHDDEVHKLLLALCTGTPGGTVAEKLAQWREALATAAAGAPEVEAITSALEETGQRPVLTIDHINRAVDIVLANRAQ